MLSLLRRPSCRQSVPFCLAIVFALALGGPINAASDDAVDAEGPVMAVPANSDSQPANTTQPKNVTQHDHSAVSEKSSDAKRTLEAETKQETKQEANSADEAKKQNEPSQGEKKTDAEPAKETVGEPLAPGMMKLLQDEIRAGIRGRGISDRFARFQNYAAGKLYSTSGRFTGSELTGNCRLRWYDSMLRNVLAAPIEAERFTRELHTAALNEHNGLAEVLAMASVKMDAGKCTPREVVAVKSADQAIDVIKQCLTEAQLAYCAAIAPLNKAEIRQLQSYLVPVLSTQNQVGHTLSDRGTGRQLCDLMERMDRQSLFTAAAALAPITDPRLLEQLKSLPDDGDVRVPGVTGSVAARIDTPSGAIIIGGKGNNTYRLDDMEGVAVVIDLGGKDAYYEGTVGPYRPVLITIDLGGNDTYRGTKPGIQGGAVLGIAMLLDLDGDDVYQAQDVAQGSALGGVGILVDYAGNDRYTGIRRVQGQSIGGIGMLVDRGGNDDYHAAMWAQGFGGPLGFGLLDDLSGNDHYYCGGMWRDSYPETPGYEGWGQGVGAGIRQVADGGIGVILDGAGDDVYEFDYLAHGGGYWCGLGFARDFGGNDQRLITRNEYNGGPRNETKFQRFGCGWGCHYSLGFCFDDAGNDVYEGTIMGTGMAWDCSMGVLCDFAGNDQYKATGGLTQGRGAQMGFGILFDYKGDDEYDGYGQGDAPSSISYHDLPGCGGNFSFVVDYGGKDKYGCGAQNPCYIQRGDVGGFLIDRPGQDEGQPTAKTLRRQSTAGI